MQIRSERLDTLDLDLPGARTLRLSVRRGADEEPGVLSIAEGWSEPWREQRSVSVPADMLPTLIDALSALARG